MKEIYLDWAATAPPDESILKKSTETAIRLYGNPSSKHGPGRRAAAFLKELRHRAGEALGVPAETLLFTSGGTESNNIVFFSLLERQQRGTVLVSEIEHPSGYEPARALEKFGFRVKTLKPDNNGQITPAELERVWERDVQLISVLCVSNETGVQQPLKALVKAARTLSSSHGRPLHFHTDAVQALGKVPLHLQEWDIDSASFSGHKIGAPRGIGMLYLRSPLPVLYRGGGQEEGRRHGTENLAGIHGFVEAAEAETDSLEEGHRLSLQRKRELIRGLSGIDGLMTLPRGVDLTGPDYSPNILTFSLPPVPGEVLTRVLNDRGIFISTGSACSSRKKRDYRVLEGMGLTREEAFSTVRVSWHHSTPASDIQNFLDVLKTEAGQFVRIR